MQRSQEGNATTALPFHTKRLNPKHMALTNTNALQARINENTYLCTFLLVTTCPKTVLDLIVPHGTCRIETDCQRSTKLLCTDFIYFEPHWGLRKTNLAVSCLSTHTAHLASSNATENVRIQLKTQLDDMLTQPNRTSNTALRLMTKKKINHTNHGPTQHCEIFPPKRTT